MHAEKHIPKRSGGLALQNFLHYYWAANIQKLLYWTVEPTAIQPAWVQVELSSSKTSLQSWLYSQLPMSTTDISANPVVTQSLKISMQFRKHFGLKHPSILAPVTHNHSFKPSIMDAAFQLWSDRGITAIKVLYDNGIFMPFAVLSAKFQLPAFHLFASFKLGILYKEITLTSQIYHQRLW